MVLSGYNSTRNYLEKLVKLDKIKERIQVEKVFWLFQTSVTEVTTKSIQICSERSQCNEVFQWRILEGSNGSYPTLILQNKLAAEGTPTDLIFVGPSLSKFPDLLLVMTKAQCFLKYRMVIPLLV